MMQGMPQPPRLGRRETVRRRLRAPLPVVPVGRILGRLARLYPEARCGLRFADPYQLLVAAVLSAQCSDAAVNRVTPGFFRRWPTPGDLAAADPAEVAGVIRSLGLYRNKAEHLVALARRLVEVHGGLVPADRAALESLPGVGRKTAGVVLANAFGVPALPVDTHVFRVARRLGLARAATPERVEEELRARIPRRLWCRAHHRLIQHGRTLCRARRPACPACPLRPLCRHARPSLSPAHGDGQER